MGNCAGVDWAFEKHDVLIEDRPGVTGGAMGNCAGIDWASEKHDVLIEDPAGNELGAATFGHDEDGVSPMCAALVCFDVEVVAIERADGLVVDRLLEAGVR